MRAFYETTVQHDGCCFNVLSGYTDKGLAATFVFKDIWYDKPKAEPKGATNFDAPLYALLDVDRKNMLKNHMGAIGNLPQIIKHDLPKNSVELREEIMDRVVSNPELPINDKTGVQWNVAPKVNVDQKSQPKTPVQQPPQEIGKGSLVAVHPAYLDEYRKKVATVSKRPFPCISVGMVINVEGGMADVSWFPLGSFDICDGMRIPLKWLRVLSE